MHNRSITGIFQSLHQLPNSRFVADQRPGKQKGWWWGSQAFSTEIFPALRTSKLHAAESTKRLFQVIDAAGTTEAKALLPARIESYPADRTYRRKEKIHNVSYQPYYHLHILSSVPFFQPVHHNPTVWSLFPLGSALCVNPQQRTILPISHIFPSYSHASFAIAKKHGIMGWFFVNIGCHKAKKNFLPLNIK